MIYMTNTVEIEKHIMYKNDKKNDFGNTFAVTVYNIK